VLKAFDFSTAADSQIQALLERALSGDAEASETLVDGIAPIIQVRVARVLLRRHGQAKGRDLRHELEDLVQEVFAALFSNGGRALRAWDPARGLGFAGFIGFLAEREVGMLMRTKKRNPWTEDPTMDTTLDTLAGVVESHEASVESRDLLRRLADRLTERLSPQGRHYFQLLYLENQPVKAIAEATGTSTDALYAWRSRLGKLLRQLHVELITEEEHVR
jgi:RNA polymerase sigma factor (sigma-70 family)